ncbi:hypothetical protein RHGRI_007844 [Rhododendron griersonianum]|uniref:Uncharacterized protein n=1 Tax=Rhododendron griersonianum TaxID=479676 RepID=A0AAV6L058_9ERIC|nr:hypothetical protein RHGRI_007844 [Rhododendron griersonianum]
MDSLSLSALLSTQRRGVIRSMWRYVLRSSGWRNMEHYFCTPTIWVHSEQKLGSSSGRWVEYSVHPAVGFSQLGVVNQSYSASHGFANPPRVADPHNPLDLNPNQAEVGSLDWFLNSC